MEYQNLYILLSQKSNQTSPNTSFTQTDPLICVKSVSALDTKCFNYNVCWRTIGVQCGCYQQYLVITRGAVVLRSFPSGRLRKARLNIRHLIFKKERISERKRCRWKNWWKNSSQCEEYNQRFFGKGVL